jgi:hypothetical protein
MFKGIVSHVIALRRHPCAVVSSWQRGIELGVMPDVFGVSVYKELESILSPLGFALEMFKTYSQIEILAIVWLADQILIERFAEEQFPVHSVVFEDLLENPTEGLRSIFGWLAIEYDASTDKFLRKSSSKNLSLRRLLGARYSYFSVDGQRDTGSWKTRLNQSEKLSILRLVGNHFDVEAYWPQCFA